MSGGPRRLHVSLNAQKMAPLGRKSFTQLNVKIVTVALALVVRGQLGTFRQTMPLRTAYTAAWTRLFTPSFSRMFAT
jgi:hypothetical protein